jgi:hypothetical protein
LIFKFFPVPKATCEVCGKRSEDISGHLKACKDCAKEGSERSKELIYQAIIEAKK